MNRCLHTAFYFMAFLFLFSKNAIAQVNSIDYHAVSETINETSKTDSLSKSKSELKLEYIYDFGKVFDPSDDLGTLRNTLEQIKRDYNVNCIIVSVDADSSVSQETVSQLFNNWTVGKSQQENILMLLFKEVHDYSNDKDEIYYPTYIYAGKNIEAYFPERVCRIIKFKMRLSNSGGALFNVNQIVDYTFLPLLKGDITPEQYIEEANQSIKDAVIFGGSSLIIILWFVFYMRLWSYGRSPAAQWFKDRNNQY